MIAGLRVRNLLKTLAALACLPLRHCRLQRSRNGERPVAPRHSGTPFVPRVHRTILWDDCEPFALLPMLCSVRRHTRGLPTDIWNAADVDALVQAYPEYAFYHRYAKRIMRADLARYLILYARGGAYFDLDIRMHRPIASLYDYLREHATTASPMQEYCLLFEEHRWRGNGDAVDETSEPIRAGLPPEYRTEALTRVANYAFVCTPEHPFMAAVLQLCEARASLPAKRDYDVLFITGPDVVSHVYHTASPSFLRGHNVVLVPREAHDDYITHHHVGAWRQR